jgi:hypothetical protein
LAPEDVHKTAFQVEGLGLLAFKKVPMVCAGSASFCQRVFELALRHLLPEVAIAYLDDIICYAPPQILLQKMGLILDRF